MEKRQAPRLRTLKRVHAAFNDEFSAVECVIKNVSDTGAFISFDDGSLIPQVFTLVNRFDGYKVDCEIVHRNGNSAGIKFIQPFERIEATRKQVVQAANYRAEADSSNVPIVLGTPQEKENLPKPCASKRRPAFGKLGKLKSVYD